MVKKSMEEGFGWLWPPMGALPVNLAKVARRSWMRNEVKQPNEGGQGQTSLL